MGAIRHTRQLQLLQAGRHFTPACLPACHCGAVQESHVSLQQQLAERQHALEAAAAEAAKLAAQKAALERQQAKLGQEAAAAEQAALERLGEQTFAEKGAAAVLRDIQAARAAVQEKEAAAEQLRGVLERLERETAGTQASSERVAAVLAGLEGVLADKAAGVAALEAEMAAGHADVEGKTRQLEALNRRYQRQVDNAKDVETGGAQLPGMGGGGELHCCRRGGQGVPACTACHAELPSPQALSVHASCQPPSPLSFPQVRWRPRLPTCSAR